MAQPQPGAMRHARTRASHTKSRRGCTSCKHRHLKCGEEVPSCHRCVQAGITCERLEVVPRRTRRVSGFRAFKLMFTPQPDDSVSSDAQTRLEFFRHRTLPLLRKCQPSVLWDVSAPCLIQSGRTFRSVAVALAHQQRLAELPEASTLDELQKDADAAYADALSSVRQSIDTDAGEDRLTLAFECLLLVVLESLRGSRAEMVVHLHCGIRIVCESPPHILRSREMQEIGRIFRQYGVSTMLLNPFMPPARETQELMWQTAGFDENGLSDDHGDLSEASNDVYRLILETLAVMYKVHYNVGQLGFEFCENVARLRTEQQRIEHLLHDKKVHADLNAHESALWNLTEARCLLAKAHLNYVWARDEAAFHSEIDTFRTVTGLLDSALSQIESTEENHSTLTFSVGLGAISALELVAWRCPSNAIRRAAVELLERCPRKEGLWNADERSRLWRDTIASEEQGFSPGFP